MKHIKKIIQNGLRNSFKSILFMLKIIIPITFIVTLLKYLDLIKYVTFIFEPLMTFLGLPGDAALVLITANLLNNYGAIAVMATLTFTVKEVTIIAIMLLFSHSLLVESAIMKGLNVSIKKQLVIRISSAMISGVILNIILGNHYGSVAYEAIISTTDIPNLSIENFNIWFMDLLTNYFKTILGTTLTITWIITSILFGLEILKEFKLLDRIHLLIFKLTKHLGFSKHASSSLLIGFFFGITYGASAILIHYKENKMTQTDITLVTTFLLLCHAIIEDVLLFMKVGAITWIIIVYKLSFTLIVIYFYSLLLARKSKVSYPN